MIVRKIRQQPAPRSRAASIMLAVDAAEHEGDRTDHEDAIDLRHADDDRQFGEEQRVDRAA